MTQPTRQTYVLSDLHLGPPNSLASFDQHATLAAVIQGWTQEAQAQNLPTELVLAGDIFDFLFCQGYQGIDPSKAPDQLRQILSHPDCAPVLDALHAFVSDPLCELTLLSGNHDPEMVLPQVRAVFEQAIRLPPTKSILYPDDEPPLLHAHEGTKHKLRVPLWGRRYDFAGGELWIVHGDRWDAFNAVNRASVRRGTAKTPFGSRLVLDVMLDLKKKYFWIDQIKPELWAAIPLMIFLEPEKVKIVLDHEDLSLDMLGRYLDAKFSAVDVLGSVAPVVPDDEAQPTPEDILEALGASLREGIEEGQPPARFAAALKEHLRYGGQVERVDDLNQDDTSDPTLSSTNALVRTLTRFILYMIRNVEKDKRFDSLDADDEIKAHLNLPARVTHLVAGHTHGPRACKIKRPNAEPLAYFNTATWLPVKFVPSGGTLEEAITKMHKGQLEDARYRLTALHIDWRPDGSPNVTLLSCDRGAISPIHP